MAEIDSAITKLEYARPTTLLDSASPSQLKNNRGSDDLTCPRYDAQVADEAYRAGCAALAAGKLDEALQSLNISLSKCPPDKTSAVAKLSVSYITYIAATPESFWLILMRNFDEYVTGFLEK